VLNVSLVSLAGRPSAIVYLVNNRLKTAKPRPIVAINLVLHFYIGVAEQEASIILGNASLAQAMPNGVAEGMKVHALAHDAKALAPCLKGVAKCRTELAILGGAALQSREQARACREGVAILE
jgi:hypothetical protein